MSISERHVGGLSSPSAAIAHRHPRDEKVVFVKKWG